jgi:hypothetical protein
MRLRAQKVGGGLSEGWWLAGARSVSGRAVQWPDAACAGMGCGCVCMCMTLSSGCAAGACVSYMGAEVWLCGLDLRALEVPWSFISC